MSDVVESKKSKERSPAFPFISLERALDRARRFYDEEKRGSAPLSRAVMHWEYSLGSSGGLQTIAALKQYGLLEDVGGSGSSRQLKLSDLALRILLDQREDASEREAHIKSAALNPQIASEIFGRWSDGLPSDSTLLHFLVVERKFSESAAASAVKILKENQTLARVNAKDIQSAATDLEKDSTVNAHVVSPPKVNSEAPSRSQVRHYGSQSINSSPAPIPADAQRVLAHMGVGITLHFTEEPTKEVFDYLARYCAFEKENVPSKADLLSRDQQGDYAAE